MRQPRVMIVDDEPIIIEMMTGFFSKRGYEIISYTEPVACPLYKGCIDRCEDRHPCADLVITDLKMPRMTGIELLERQSLKGCKIDVKNKVLMSGDLDHETMKRIRVLGCAFFEKPFKLSELSDWLSHREKRFDLSQPLTSFNSCESAP